MYNKHDIKQHVIQIGDDSVGMKADSAEAAFMQAALDLARQGLEAGEVPVVKAWLDKHPRFHIHFTPTSASWLNMVERFFRSISMDRLERGVAHDQQTVLIYDHVDTGNPASNACGKKSLSG